MNPRLKLFISLIFIIIFISGCGVYNLTLCDPLSIKEDFPQNKELNEKNIYVMTDQVNLTLNITKTSEFSFKEEKCFYPKFEDINLTIYINQGIKNSFYINNFSSFVLPIKLDTHLDDNSGEIKTLFIEYNLFHNNESYSYLFSHTYQYQVIPISKKLELLKNKFNLGEIILIILNLLVFIVPLIRDIYTYYKKPSLKIEDITCIYGKDGNFYLIPIKNKKETIANNCSPFLNLESKINNKPFFIEGDLSWKASKTGIVNINGLSESSIDLCFNPKNTTKIKFPSHLGYNNFIQAKYKGGKEFGEEIDLKKIKNLKGKIKITSANAKIEEKEILIKWGNKGPIVKFF